MWWYHCGDSRTGRGGMFWLSRDVLSKRCGYPNGLGRLLSEDCRGGANSPPWVGLADVGLPPGVNGSSSWWCRGAGMGHPPGEGGARNPAWVELTDMVLPPGVGGTSSW